MTIRSLSEVPTEVICPSLSFGEAMVYGRTCRTANRDVWRVFKKQTLCLQQLFLLAPGLVNAMIARSSTYVIQNGALNSRLASTTQNEDQKLERFFTIFSRGFCEIKTAEDVRSLKEAEEVVQQKIKRDSQVPNIGFNLKLMGIRCDNLCFKFNDKILHFVMDSFARQLLDSLSEEHYETKVAEMKFLFPKISIEVIREGMNRAVLKVQGELPD